jgi:hypothetical protein
MYVLLMLVKTQYYIPHRTYKLPGHPRQKPRREGYLKQINSCRKVPFQVTFKMPRFYIAIYPSTPTMAQQKKQTCTLSYLHDKD